MRSRFGSQLGHDPTKIVSLGGGMDNRVSLLRPEIGDDVTEHQVRHPVYMLAIQVDLEFMWPLRY